MTGHPFSKQSTNYRILKALKHREGEWMSSAEIVKAIGICSARGVGEKLSYMKDMVPGIEMMIRDDDHKRIYRYVETAAA